MNNYEKHREFVHNQKGIKGIIKRKLHDLTAPLIHAVIMDEEEKIQKLDRKIDDVKKHMSLIEDKQSEWNEKFESDMGAVARQTMLAKWKIIDHETEDSEAPEDVLICDVCGKSHQRKDYRIVVSKCIFNGGELKRYICPECGVIFGPTKFLEQSQQEIDEDYWVHYLGFSEGDSSWKEERTFRKLQPQRDKVYLNYGCGKWSKTLQKLRDEGFDVYGYEPYAPEISNPYLITSKDKLSRMRFDGIFSNDLLEHLISPVEDLKFMKELLWDDNSRMAHSTCCYEYKYEYTRFHTHFFVGQSREILAKKAGLKIVEYCDDLEGNDFICTVYQPYNIDNHEMRGSMYVHSEKKQGKEEIVLNRGEYVYGPYIPLAKGDYVLSIMCCGTLEWRITCDNGHRVIRKCEEATDGGNVKVRFCLNHNIENAEFVLKACDEEIRIKSIKLYRE